MSGGAVEGISVDDLLKAKGALENVRRAFGPTRS